MDRFSHSKAPDGASPAVQFPKAEASLWTLENGLALIVQEDHSAPVASVQAWVETGSIHESAHLGSGVSHLLEHMLFKGTETRGASEFAQGVQDAGGYINAYTSFDRTVYWIDIPSKGAATAIELLSDAVMHSTLPPDEYVKEQEVIRREFAMGADDPDRVSSHALFATAYREHPYRHPVIGHLDVFNGLHRDDVMRYYKARYVPNNIFLVVAGDVDAAAVHGQCVQLFASSERQSLPPVFIPAEPVQLGRREYHRDFPTELTRLNLAWHIPALTHPDIPALDVLAVVLGGGRSSRFYQRLREAGWAHSCDAWCYASGQPGLFGVDALLDPGKRAEVQTRALEMISEIAASGVSEAELSKARALSLSHQLSAVTTMRGKASDLGSNWLLTRNLDFSRDYLAAIQRVTEADLRRVAATYCHERNLTVTSLHPPAPAGARTVTSRSASREVQRFELSNGLRLLVCEDPRLPLVSIAASFRAGLLAETEKNNGITRLLAKVLLKGSAQRTAEQLADAIEAVGGSISSDAGNNSLNLFVRVMQPDVRLGLDLLSDALLAPALPESAIAREKEVQLASIVAEEEEPTTVARRLLRRRLFRGHPYGLRHLGSPESVASLDRTQLQAFYERHTVARNGVLAVFGNVRADEIRAWAEAAFGALPAGDLAFPLPPQPTALHSSEEIVEIKDKQQAVLMTGCHGVDLFSPDRAALELIDEASSDLGSRFFLRIREEMGLAYFVGSSFVVGLSPGPFTFYLGTDPAKLEEVKAALHDEIRKLAEHGLTAQELERAKEKYLGSVEIRNQSNDAFAHACALDELYGLGFDHYLRARAQVQAVTLQDIRTACRKYFSVQPAITVVVRPAP